MLFQFFQFIVVDDVIMRAHILFFADQVYYYAFQKPEFLFVNVFKNNDDNFDVTAAELCSNHNRVLPLEIFVPAWKQGLQGCMNYNCLQYKQRPQIVPTLDYKSLVCTDGRDNEYGENIFSEFLTKHMPVECIVVPPSYFSYIRNRISPDLVIGKSFLDRQLFNSISALLVAAGLGIASSNLECFFLIDLGRITDENLLVKIIANCARLEIEPKHFFGRMYDQNDFCVRMKRTLTERTKKMVKRKKGEFDQEQKDDVERLVNERDADVVEYLETIYDEYDNTIRNSMQQASLAVIEGYLSEYKERLEEEESFLLSEEALKVIRKVMFFVVQPWFSRF